MRPLTAARTIHVFVVHTSSAAESAAEQGGSRARRQHDDARPTATLPHAPGMGTGFVAPGSACTGDVGGEGGLPVPLVGGEVLLVPLRRTSSACSMLCTAQRTLCSTHCTVDAQRFCMFGQPSATLRRAAVGRCASQRSPTYYRQRSKQRTVRLPEIVSFTVGSDCEGATSHDVRGGSSLLKLCFSIWVRRTCALADCYRWTQAAEVRADSCGVTVRLETPAAARGRAPPR